MDSALIADQFSRRGYIVVRDLIAQNIIEYTRNFLVAETAKRYAPGYRPIHTDNPVATLQDVGYVGPIAKVLKLSGILDALLGPTTFLRLPPGARAVHPHHPAGLGPVHQDGARLRDLDNFVTVWVPFVEIDHACGGLGLYPDLGHTCEIPEGSHGIDVGSATPMPIYLSPGDVLIFHKWMPHGSAPNVSNRIRYSMDLRFYSTLHRMAKVAIDL